MLWVPLVSEVVRRQHSLEDLLDRLLGVEAEDIVRDVLVLDQASQCLLISRCLSHEQLRVLKAVASFIRQLADPLSMRRESWFLEPLPIRERDPR
jgi:hypothetical protein